MSELVFDMRHWLIVPTWPSQPHGGVCIIS